jgi:hypothetical protein
MNPTFSQATKKVAVYTCIAGTYDNLKEVSLKTKDVDFICFTNLKFENSKGWIIRSIPKNFKSNILANRFVKMHAHLLLQEYDISVYIDGSIKVVGDIYSFALNSVEHELVAMYQHPFRNCLYEEAEICKIFGFDWHWKFDRQIRKCKSDHYPRDNGLFECGVIVSQHMHPKIIELMGCWWREFEYGVKRDQIMLPYLTSKLKIKVNNLGASDPRFSHKIFILQSHIKKPTLPIRIRGYLYRNFFWRLSGKFNSDDVR